MVRQDVTCKTTFAKQKPQPLVNCVQCTLSQVQLVSGFPVNATSTKEDSCVGWVGNRHEQTVKSRNGSSTWIIYESARDSWRVPPAAARGTTAFSPNLWRFHQHQGDWARGQNPVRSPTGFCSSVDVTEKHLLLPAIHNENYTGMWHQQKFCQPDTTATKTPTIQKTQRARVARQWYRRTSVHLILQLHRHQLYKIHIAQEFHGNGTDARLSTWYYSYTNTNYTKYTKRKSCTAMVHAQELRCNGTDARVVFYEWLQHTILCILPSNKVYFHLSGTVNRYNAMYWSDELLLSIADPRSMVGAASMAILL
jgi:hypothetical protein